METEISIPWLDLTKDVERVGQLSIHKPISLAEFLRKIKEVVGKVDIITYPGESSKIFQYRLSLLWRRDLPFQGHIFFSDVSPGYKNSDTRELIDFSQSSFLADLNIAEEDSEGKHELILSTTMGGKRLNRTLRRILGQEAVQNVKK